MTLPKHIAIIMDGNGRWATRQNKPRLHGHRAGVKSLQRAIQCALNNRIETLTVFALSTENMQRPMQEVDFLLGLLEQVLAQEIVKLHAQGVKLHFIGAVDVLPKKLQNVVRTAEKKTNANKVLNLNIALNYSGRWHIQQMLDHMLHRKHNDEAVSIADIQNYFHQDIISDPDLLIRTGGEQRISNFMLWSLAYTELYFTNVFWPDFAEADFDKALAFYRQRERRFGQIQGAPNE